MPFSAANYKAIDWYAESMDAVPQLSSYPIAHFKLKKTGEEISGNVFDLTALHSTFLREERREKARLKRQQQKAAS